MKKLKYFTILLFIGLNACDYFLDLEPLDIISDAVVWEDEALVDAYLANLYANVDFFETRGDHNYVSLSMIAAMGGEGRSFNAIHQSYLASTNVITSSGINSQLDYWKYQNIRDCNYFIENLQGSILDEDFVNQRIAEARFIRAYMYFQMLIRFGGVPIITTVQSIDATPEELFVARNSEKEVYDFIISEMEEIAQILPSQYDLSDKGRPTKWAAYAFQSRAAIYAASIANYGTVQLDGLLGFPASDVDQYAQISYDACQAILNSGFYFLYEKHADPVINYQNIFLDESADNTEVIMAEVYDFGNNRAHGFSLRSMPQDFGSGVVMYYLYDWTERFEFADGSPGTSISRTQLQTGEWSPAELWENRDPRFRASVFYPESPWQGSKVYIHNSTIRDGVKYTSGVAEDGWPYAAPPRNHQRTGFMVKKRCNEYKDISGSQLKDDDTDYIIFRVGETYLNLAEAAYYLDLPDEALTTINRLRQRAGMPPKDTISIEIIQNERLVELTWENQSYWDLRRWRIARQVLDGVRMQAAQYTYNYDTKKYRIKLVNSEGVPRPFDERNYYLPLGVNRVAENPNFVENPDY